MKYFLLILLATYLYSYSYAQETELLKAEVEGTSITIIDSNIYVNCGAKFKWENISTANNQIDILYTDTSSQRMKCMCLFTLRTTVKFLSPGKYTINVLRKEWEDSEIKFIGKLNAVVTEGPTMPPLSYVFKQSDCYSHTDIANDDFVQETGHLYPNPAKENFTVEFELQQAGNADLIIKDIFGRRILSRNLGLLNAGLNKININTGSEHFAPGVYYCSIITGDGGRKTFKFIMNN